jgi:hypothetical protein
MGDMDHHIVRVFQLGLRPVFDGNLLDCLQDEGLVIINCATHVASGVIVKTQEGSL